MASADCRSPLEMMAQAEYYAASKVAKPATTTVPLAISAGLFIALGYLFFITVTTGAGDSGWGSMRLLGGLAFSSGLMMVVICGGELFTSSVLSAIAAANRQIGVGRMVQIWGWIYLGNLLGALLLVALVMAGRLYLLDQGQWGLNVLNLAQHKLHHGMAAAFALGVLCNLLVCLAVWMSFSCDQVLTKALLLMLPVALFVSSGFEHCVANMFVVPLAMAIHHWAPPQFWLQIGIDASQFADLRLTTFLSANLLPVTIGNIVGGALLVGLGYRAIYRRLTPACVSLQPAANNGVPNLSHVVIEELKMPIRQLKIKEIMTQPELLLEASMPIGEALTLMLNKRVSGAPVRGSDGSLVGYLSQHDLLVALWCNDYRPLAERQVAEVMHQPLVAINGEETVVHLAERMAIDVEALYPVSGQGVATSLSAKSLLQRARDAKPSSPHHYPVLIQGRFKGMVSRHQLMTALAPLLVTTSTAITSPRRIA